MGGELIITNATVCPAHLSTASRPTDKGAHFTLQTITKQVISNDENNSKDNKCHCLSTTPLYLWVDQQKRELILHSWPAKSSQDPRK